MKRLLAGLMSMICLLSLSASVAAEETQQAEKLDTVNGAEVVEMSPAIEELSTNSFSVDLSVYTSSDGHAKAAGDTQFPAAVALTEDGYIEWKLDVPETGYYNLTVDYLPTPGKGATASRRILIDGELPNSSCSNLLFYRSYTNETNDFAVNAFGDEVRPSQIEKPVWLRSVLRDAGGSSRYPLQFYLTAGEHVLRMEAMKEPLTIGALTFSDATTIPTYEAYQEKWQGKDEASAEPIVIQGEDAALKSDSMMYPISDGSSSAVQPSSAESMLLNSIGGSKWQTSGQWLEWNVTVKQSGFYRLSLVAKQDQQAGQPSSRRLYIDGEVPFAEVDCIRFEYDTDYHAYTLGGDEPYLFYLEKGDHTIRLEVTIGALTDVVEEVREIMSELSEIYRRMLMLMGSSPDANRDYQLDDLMPEELQLLKEQTARLSAVSDRYAEITGQKGAQLQQLVNAVRLLQRMNENHKKIPRWFGNFSETVTSLGNWVNTARSQPLQLDYMVLDTPSQPAKLQVEPSFGQEFMFQLKRFIYSFIHDYQVESKEEDTVTVWMTSGRDQSTTLNQLAKNQFTSQTGISVNLQLITGDTLMMATVAGRGPDVALGISQTDTINYAIRGASTDLTQMAGYQEVMQRFQKSACEPLSYKGAWYGVPETQTFFVMFYRRDILDDLGLKAPETWDDLRGMLPLLAQNNMTVGLPPVLQTYAMLLYQYGGQLYNDDGTACLIDDAAGIAAFDDWVKLYSEYGLPVDYDFPTRFRSGEMPIGVVDYGTYNMMSAFAPELEGVWGIAEVPGTLQADGTVDHSTSGVVTSTILMADSDKKEQAWEFIRWWTSAEVQTRYGNELESILGTTGRYQPANKESLYSIPWDTASFKLLTTQWEKVRAIPELPGSYMTSRYIDFAYKKYVVDSGVNAYLKDAGQLMIDAATSIEKELEAKRREFEYFSR